MTAIMGFAGAVKIGTYTVAEIDNWNLSIDSDVLKTTKFGDTWKEQIAGVRMFSGKFGGRWDMTDTNGQVAFQSACMGGTTVTIILTVNGSHFYTGSVWIKNISPKAIADATVDVDMSFEGTGALTYS
jgi:predicted secreted protein